MSILAFNPIIALLVTSLVAAAVLAFVSDYRWSARLNILASFVVLLFALLLFRSRPPADDRVRLLEQHEVAHAGLREPDRDAQARVAAADDDDRQHGAAPSIDGLMAPDRFLHRRHQREAGPKARGEQFGAVEERVDAGAVDELQRAAGPAWEADAEDRADVGVVRRSQHALGEAARGLDRLAVQQPVFELLHVPARIGFFEQGLELRPQRFLLALRIVVEAAAGRAAVAVVLLDHALDQQLEIG